MATRENIRNYTANRPIKKRHVFGIVREEIPNNAEGKIGRYKVFNNTGAHIFADTFCVAIWVSEEGYEIIYPQNGGGVIPGFIDCYLANGRYKVTLGSVVDDLIERPDCIPCEEDCREAICTWEWTEFPAEPPVDPPGAWTKVTDSCSTYCTCVAPTKNGTFNLETATTLCSQSTLPEDHCDQCTDGWCEWEWNIPEDYDPEDPESPQPSWQEKDNQCGAGEDSIEPSHDGQIDGETFITICENSVCKLETWKWTGEEQDDGSGGWVIQNSYVGCDECYSQPPAEEGDYIGQLKSTFATTINPEFTCPTIEDPTDLCCAIEYEDECPDPPRNIIEKELTTVIALQLSKVTLPKDTPVWLQPIQNTDYYAIVSTQLDLMCLQIPTAVTCCPDGSILFSQYDRVIVEGLACESLGVDCPE